jgi:uncharacterized membrane protein YbhN (UPF0104 family)
VARRLDWSAFAAALSHVNYFGYMAFMVVFVALLLAADSVAMAHVYVRYVCPVRWSELIVLRGGSYLPAIVNYHIGQAWLTWFASRVYGARLARVAGATLLNYATMFGSLALFAALAYPMGGQRPPWLGTTLTVVAILASGYALVVVLKPAFLLRVPGVSVLFDAGLAGHLRALAWRLPHMMILFAGMWLPFRFFGIAIPLGEALACVPILMLIGALPLTPQGVGARDVVALTLLTVPDGTPREVIAAATLSWAIAISLIEALIGAIFSVYARRLLRREKSSNS